ncbi:MAG: riboflavin synthase subunit alpha [Pantoea sp. Brub]|nr:riboflavin synthase subunit alpha [Pantoea sp. Brub]
MFTGIVQGIAEIVHIRKKNLYNTAILKFSKELLLGLNLGSSVMINGCCLTITDINDSLISFDLIEETLKISNLNELCIEDLVNIERSITLNSEVGGHLLSGHVVTTAKIKEIVITNKKYEVWFEMKNLNLMKYIFYKGFISIDGISLTVSTITKNKFSVFLIPETIKRTTISQKNIGDSVNIEIDFKTQAIVDTVERIMYNYKTNIVGKNLNLST